MNISENGLNLIKSFEGCRLTAYRCPAGVWTIGWGHTGGVYEGQTITQAQADEMLVSDLASYERKVDKYSSYGWNQNEFDALVSFAYNIGSIDQLTANGTRTRAVIADKMLEYNKAAGKILAGIVFDSRCHSSRVGDGWIWVVVPARGRNLARKPMGPDLR